ncbi:ABC transporter permease [Alicyclobacillus shizuokensis]|uniref:ABC transporter permease n=1 Tax=Alicyclobacillus shizuokensis TaxID=392014 RepID=UPI000AB690B6|nr:ABC transporter permease [Alicyclobacillus shizuokensis]
MNGALVSDWIKMRKTWIKILVILGPFGVISLNAVRYALNYHGIVRPGDDAYNWALLIQNISHLLMPTLMLGIALLASLLSGLEHQGHAWKQLLALPVSRVQLYLSKFIWIAGLLAISATLCAVGTILLGFAFGFTPHVPWAGILEECYYPYLAAYGVIAIQLLLSVLVANQSFAITLGVLGMIISGLSDALSPDGLTHAGHWAPFVPWVYPSLSALTHGAVQHVDFAYVVYGLLAGGLLLALGTGLFARKEVK